MNDVKNHIESITNGNSKGLAYWIAIGVISLVLTFAKDVIIYAFDKTNDVQPSDVLLVVKEIKDIEKQQLLILQQGVLDRFEIKHNVKEVLKEAEKMEAYKNKNP